MRELPQEVKALVAVARALGFAVAAIAATAGLGAAQGDAARGEQIFAAKQCAHCHRAPDARGVGPPLTELRRPQGAYELSGRLWNHAPAMFTALAHEGLAWPVISEPEMTDLMAYLQADPGRDPKADTRKGQMTLVNKGCLKCHAFRGEGARIAGDLATARDAYASPARWTSTMWSHTPRIAKKAIERGIPYPRFTGDEMTHLLGYLRTGSAGR